MLLSTITAIWLATIAGYRVNKRRSLVKLLIDHSTSPRITIGWEKLFRAFPFSPWVLDAPLEWPIRGFSLCPLCLLTLPPLSSVSCLLFFNLLLLLRLDRPITFRRLSRIAPPQLLPPSPSLHRFVCPSHIPISSTLALDLPSLLLSQPSFLIHHIIYYFVFFVDFSSLPPPSFFATLHAIHASLAYSHFSVLDPRHVPLFPRSQTPRRTTPLLNPRFIRTGIPLDSVLFIIETALDSDIVDRGAATL